MPRTKKSTFKGIQRQFLNLNDESNESKQTVSEKKIEGNTSADRPRPFSDLNSNFAPVTGNRIIDMELLQDALNKAHRCTEGKFLLQENITERKGLCSAVYLCCSACQKKHKFFTSKQTDEKEAEINKVATFAAVEAGLGREGLSDIMSILNIPPPVSTSNYATHVSKLLDVSKSVAKEQMKSAVDNLRNKIINEADGAIDDQSIIDVAVSYDGTWSKRGFTANHGIGVVLSIDTGEVLDIEILSKVCEICKQNKGKKNKSDFEAWREKHKLDGSCQANYEGSSPNMETEAAYRLWNRSIAQYRIRYKWMISDGDSKAHQRVSEIYGTSEGDKVEKLDCIGHVGKRMYRALTAIKIANKGKLADGKTVGGRKGRLTEPIIRRLSDLYRNAIRQNVNPNAKTLEEKKVGVEILQKNIRAVLYHSINLDDPETRHKFCPQESWCEWKKDGKNVVKDHHLDPVFLDILEPTFTRLSEYGLMERCLPGFSQNQNESFNSLVWKRSPKHAWKGPKVISIAAYLAALNFNVGTLEARSSIFASMALSTTEWLELSAEKKDKKRIYGARRDAEEASKRRRKSVTMANKMNEANSLIQEGTTYESGSF